MAPAGWVAQTARTWRAAAVAAVPSVIAASRAWALPSGFTLTVPECPSHPWGRAGADLDQRVRGLRWGLGTDWETLILDVTPLSYAQCGLYRQFQRSEDGVYATLSYLYRRRWGTESTLRNVPNMLLWLTRHM